MTEEIKAQLRLWASQYHNAQFIPADPVQFPHRYTQPSDIEIMGLLTAIMSFGNRTMILRKVNQLDDLMQHSPLDYLLSQEWKYHFHTDDTSSFYRMLSHADVRVVMQRIYDVYREGETLEDRLMTYSGIPMQRLCAFMGVTDRSPQKKLNMFLRWMVRTNSPVDFGLWTRMSPSDLIIPLDTHVCRVSHQIGLTSSHTFSLGNARRITDSLAEIFPGDPCMGDFALFGYGVNHKDE